MNASDAYRDFVLRSQKIAISHGYDIINWYAICQSDRHQKVIDTKI